MTNAVALESDISVFRFVVHTGDIKNSLNHRFAYCAGLLLIQANIRIWMTTESPYRELSVAASVLITFLLHNIYFGRMGVAQPQCIVYILGNPFFFGARMGLPGFGPGQAHIKKLAKRLGGALAQSAANNFGAHVLDSAREAILQDKDLTSKKSEENEGQTMLSEEASVLMSRQGITLKKFLDQCLPQSPPDRLKQLCVGMIRGDMHLKTIAMAAKNSALLLHEVLIDDEHMAVNMRAGERLAIIHGALQIDLDDLKDISYEPIRKIRKATNVIMVARANSVRTSGGSFGMPYEACDKEMEAGHVPCAWQGEPQVQAHALSQTLVPQPPAADVFETGLRCRVMSLDTVSSSTGQTGDEEACKIISGDQDVVNIDHAVHHMLTNAGLDLEALKIGAYDRRYLASKLEKAGVHMPGDRIRILNTLSRRMQE